MRSTWAVGGINDAAVALLQSAVTTAQAKADAAMVKANTAATTATTAVTTATTAVQASSTTAASLDQLNTAIANADKTHAGFQAAIDALQSRVQTIGFGYTTLGVLLALNASTDVVLTLSRDMGRADYNVEPGSISGAAITVKAKTRTTVTLTVKATAALSVGTPVLAVAWI